MRIELRDRTADTVVTYFRMTRDPAVCRYLPQKAKSEQEALDDFEKTRRPGCSSYGRTVYADGRYVGDVWCYGIQREEPNAMVSYCIFERPYWGRGIATKALKLFLAEVKTKFCAGTFGAFTFSENESSIRVLLKNGFTCVETFTEDAAESKYFQKKC